MQKPSDDKNHELADKLSFYFRDPGTTRATIPVSLASDIIAALRGELYVVETISSAPKDGTPILAFNPTWYQRNGGWCVAVWLKDGWHSVAGTWRIEPSHWSRLPAAPTCESETGS